ncbi:MAG TPA: hypothetical protein VLB76_24700 [Thermoanaerobaculia bacterium]|nr:hypothetical protein [Thermoanaerobaculia bacterium]
MRVNHRTLVRLFLLLALAWAVAAPGGAEQRLPMHNRIAEPVVGATRIDWLPIADSETLALTVSSPGEFWIHKEFAAGQPASLSLSEHLPDGSYTWELRTTPSPGKLPQKPLVVSGHFFVKDGSFVAARKKAPAVPRRPPLSPITPKDFFEDGNMVVVGNACIGQTCTNNDDDYSALKLKAPQPNILFDDDFVEGGSTPHDWGLFINPSSAAEFSIADVENGLIPFTIAGGTPTNSLYMASNGNLGLGTATPGSQLHLLNSADVPTVMWIQSTSSGVNGISNFRAQSDTVAVHFRAHGSGRTINHFGVVLGGWSEVVQDIGNGLLIGTLNNTPIIMGTNNTNRLQIDGSTGTVTVNGNLTVTGTKNFAVADPADARQAIYYTALEGPEAGTYFRGTAKTSRGEAVIELPDYFARLTEPERLTVQLTPLGSWGQLYVAEKTPSRLVVRMAPGSTDLEFDYFVQGVRKGYLDYQVERPNTLPK